MSSAQLPSLLQKKDLVYDLLLLGLVFQLDSSPSLPKALLKENLRKVLSHSPKPINCWSLCPQSTPVLQVHFQRWNWIILPEAITEVSRAGVGCRLHGQLHVCPTLFPHPWDPPRFFLHITSTRAFVFTFTFFPSFSCLHPLSALHQPLPGLLLSKMVITSSPLPWANRAAVMLSTLTKESVCL